MSDRAKVYFLRINDLSKIKELLPEFKPPLGIKVHFGEEGNVTHLPASLIKPIVAMVDNPTFVETSVLYKSPRRTASGHRRVALSHGFDFAPLDFLDGEEGDDYREKEIRGRHFEKCYLGAGLDKYKSLLVISHFKGHGGAGFGGAIKNLGMGLSSRRGKLAMHASIKHQVSENRCISCGLCLNSCPVRAISFAKDKKAIIDQKVCISCSKCIAVCPEKAIKIPWKSTESKILQERIAEYAFAGAENKQCFFINFLINITEGCDCEDRIMEKLVNDIGVLISADPVAIDQASYDLVTKQDNNFLKFKGIYQILQAEKFGLGKRQYKLIEL